MLWVSIYLLVGWFITTKAEKEYPDQLADGFLGILGFIVTMVFWLPVLIYGFYLGVREKM